MTLLKKFGWRHYSRICSMRPLERTDVFIGCCVDHAEGHDERRPVPLLSHYLHVIPVSMIVPNENSMRPASDAIPRRSEKRWQIAALSESSE